MISTSNNILGSVINGARLSSDRVYTTLSDKPIYLNRQTRLKLLINDLSGKLLQLNSNGSILHRWIFKEDLVYPSIFCLTKSEFLLEMNNNKLFDSALDSAYLNGIESIDKIYVDDIKQQLPGESILKLIEHYETSDSNQKNDINLVLESNGVYKIPVLTVYNEAYQCIEGSNALIRNNRFKTVSEGWMTGLKVLRKQTITYC